MIHYRVCKDCKSRALYFTQTIFAYKVTSAHAVLMVWDYPSILVAQLVGIS